MPIHVRTRRFLLAVAAVAPPGAGAATEPALTVVVGVTESGEATPQWSAILRQRLPPDRYEAASRVRRPLTASEKAWVDLIRSRVAPWQDERPGLAMPFAPVPPPERVAIVVGNRAASGDDAFTHDATTIGFDLGELQSAYGEADRPENADRIDRFFRHEYTHLLERAWLAVHPWDSGTPMGAALLEIWKEGLGNYYSLSSRWLAKDGGGLSATARDTLAALEPRLVSRLSGLACAAPDRVSVLGAGLSRGPFDRKWGALPVALWLASEPGDPRDALRAFVQSGPAGVWDLAGRRLTPPLGAVLSETRQAALACQDASR